MQRLKLLEERESHTERGGLLRFVKYFWHTIEPSRPLVDGWPLEAICDHLEAVAHGDITRLLINVPPGFMKSLCANVFWPAWVWGALRRPSMRFIAASYSQSLTLRDNVRFRNIIMSPEYQAMYGGVFGQSKEQFNLVKVANNKTGWKLATSVGGVGTGERGDFFLCLPWAELILTDIGWLPIGHIVDNHLDVKVAGLNEHSNAIVWQGIEEYERNAGRELVEIVWQDGSLRCTKEHPVFVQGRGYVAASEVKEGDGLVWTGLPIDLSEVRKRNPSQAEPSAEILQQRLPLPSPEGIGADCEQQTMHSLRRDGLPAACALEAQVVRHSLLQPRMPREVEHGAEQPSMGRRESSQGLQVVRQVVHLQSNGSETSYAKLLLGIVRKAIRLAKIASEASIRKALRAMRETIQAKKFEINFLLFGLQGPFAFLQDFWPWQWTMGARAGCHALSSWMDKELQGKNPQQGWQSLPDVRIALREGEAIGCASYRLQQGQSRSEQPNNSLPVLPWYVARREEGTCGIETKVVQSIKECGREDIVYNLRVSPCHNYFANGVLVHNCDDGNSVKEAESEAIISSTNQWFLEVVPTRLNDAATGAIINIQQRTAENDISGTILAKELDYVHLIIRMEHDSRFAKVPTCIGWTDPREEDGELAWPERFPRHVVEDLKKTMGPYAVGGQFQQSPEPRGGGILRREYWNIWETEDGKYPSCDYIIASLDPALTSKDDNDPSGFTIWGTFDHNGDRAAILLYAWRKWLVLHGPTEERWSGETSDEYRARTQANWGLVEHVADALRRFKVDRLLIEDKANGHDVNVEMLRLYGDLCSYELVNPGRLDKTARAIRVQPIFSEGQVFRPDRKYAAMVEDECAIFPKGKHDDLVDSATMGLFYLRSHGFLTRRSEKLAEREREARNYKFDAPLYPV